MSEKETKFNIDNTILKILFIINAWDEKLLSDLKNKNINNLKSLIALSDSTYEFIQLVTNLKWDKYNQYTTMKDFCAVFDSFKKKRISSSAPIPNYGYGPPIPHIAHYPNYAPPPIPAPAPAPVPTVAPLPNAAPLPGAPAPAPAPVPMAAPLPMGAPAPAPLCAPPPMGAPAPMAAPLPGGAPSPALLGFSVGGSKDVNAFRKKIENNSMPQLDSITYEGLFYDYYFDTTGSKDDVKQIDDEDEKQIEQNKTDNKPLFYPSYSFAKSMIPKSLLMANSNNVTKKTNDMIENDEIDIYNFHIDDKQQTEYYMTIGLNSNMTVQDFSRKKLNLVIVLDVSGSMGGSFGGYGYHSGPSKMKVANECVLSLITHLKYDDRFGMVLFDDRTRVFIQFKQMKDHTINDIERIQSIRERGGTNFEIGYKEGMKMFNSLSKFDCDIQQYENRLIFLTDAHPNAGRTDPNSLIGMVKKAATNKEKGRRVYTTFVGVGLDFNANLVQEITKVRGANYFAVHSSKDFFKRLDLEFDYFVSPMVFDLKLTIQSEGGGVCIDEVYGSNNIDSNNGEVMNITSLFPSPPNESGAVKGGIVIIKLKKNSKTNKYENVNIECSFENKFGKRFSTTESVIIASVKQKEIYPNSGVRKAILLTRYVILIKKWISLSASSKYSLSVSPQWKQIIETFLKYFENEMKMIKDDTLSQEVKILKKLL